MPKETKGDTQFVLVYGPNLRDPSGVTFHVHTPGCADTRKRFYLSAEQPWTAEVATVLDLVADIYPPDCFLYDLNDEDDRMAYEQDIKIFPCVKGLK